MGGKRVVSSLVVAGLILLGLPLITSVAFMQGGGGTWDTGFNIQNLGSSQATVSVEYYDPSGNPVFTDGSTIDVGSNWNVYVPGISALPVGRYSVVVSSNQPVAVVANNINSSSRIGDSYRGSAPGSSTVYLPLIYRGHSGYTSIIYAQNAGGTSQEIQVSLYNVGSSVPAVTQPYTVAPGAAQEIDITDSAFDAFGTTYGSAVVTGTQDIAVMVGYVRNPDGEATHMVNGEYRGFAPAAAGSTLFAPLVFKNHSGWQTGIQVQNTEGVETTVTVTYTASPDSSAYPLVVTDTLTLGANSSGTFYLPGNPDLPDGFFGGAELSSDSSDILAVVNNVKYNAPSGAVGSIYEAFNPSLATDHIAAPLVYRNYHGNETGIQVQNVGSSSTDITMVVTKSPTSSPTGPGSPGPWTLTASGVGPGEVATFYFPGTSELSGVADLYGSAAISSTGGVPIVAVVNSTRYSYGFSTNYAAENYTP